MKAMAREMDKKGPLVGVRIVEFAGMGPAPFCAMWLSDMGADVIRIDRAGERPRGASGEFDVLQRGRRSIALDLKDEDGRAIARRIATNAQMLIEGFRPGVMERLGLGPEKMLCENPNLIYGRITGWGQYGPLSQAAGHDLNYLALSGALFGIGADGSPPAPPLNLVADFGGGGMLLALGMLSAYIESLRTGRGQIVDAAMSDGSALLMSMLYGYKAMGRWNGQNRGCNFLDGSAHFYTTYECADRKFIAVGAIEKPFYVRFLEGLGFDPAAFSDQWAHTKWSEYKQMIALRVLSRSRDAWADHFASVDACVTPVLDMEEAPLHPHNVARGTFVTSGSVCQPGRAPRYSATPAEPLGAIPRPGEHALEILTELGISQAELDRLRSKGVAPH
ncbi:CaiB/BaiF CoA-transferase family protein [Pseudorhodoferax sp. Leaf265]|uniref:CaiB/BaiF CoA transferase family protein n=1 Tax=Pseudorhodoferax sp. Leaf265 TaxID=1736315 RepID=UPI0009EB4FEA|nr:CaiB/BaiF CoA-transferase family protein [Pseudorhodoferax sp. Leaf265]